MKLKVTRDITPAECPWLGERTFAAGDIVFSFHKATYGAIGPYGRAVSLVDGEHPFIELPRDALEVVQP